MVLGESLAVWTHVADGELEFIDTVIKRISNKSSESFRRRFEVAAECGGAVTAPASVTLSRI